MLRTRPVNLWRRFGAACLAFWFIVLTMDLASAHDCPMHDGAALPASTASARMDHGAHAVHAAHADGATAAPADSEQHDSEQHDSGHSCTCMGDCSASTVPMFAAASEIALAQLVGVRTASPGRSEQEFMAAWVDFVLPFSTAPPTPAAA